MTKDKADELITHSYTRRQGEFLVATYKDPIGKLVLNDDFVNKTFSESKYKRNNPYEEKLNECEDQRFELDMLLETVNSATKHVKELLDKLQPNNPICMDDHFTVQNIRFIERLYGDYGLEVINMIKNNPSLALPCILKRLKQRQEEWTRCHSEFNKGWADVYAKNFNKSLDHKSYDQQYSKKSKEKAKSKDEIKEKAKSKDEINDKATSKTERNKAKSKVESKGMAKTKAETKEKDETKEKAKTKVETKGKAKTKVETKDNAKNMIKDQSESSIQEDKVIRKSTRQPKPNKKYL